VTSSNSSVEVSEELRSRAVTDWLEQNTRAYGPFRFSLIAGGRSNLTFLVTPKIGTPFVLRRPPVGMARSTAHDMAREYRIVSALRHAAVPVPDALGHCDDPAVASAPFWIMSLVEGLVLRSREDAEAQLSMESRAEASRATAQALVDIHATDLLTSGLDDLGRPSGYIARQVHRWGEQVERVVQGSNAPQFVSVRKRLDSRIPVSSEHCLLHGDYRIDNVIMSTAGAVDAVVDWELSTLGDPLADLGSLLAQWHGPDDEQPIGWEATTSAAGFLSRAEMADLYASGSGRDLSNLNFYLAFAAWRVACVLEVTLARYREGRAGGDRSNMTSFRDRTLYLLNSADQFLDEK
jgi:aminoglycoside phosphotransferase (APT) family kinase protein